MYDEIPNSRSRRVGHIDLILARQIRHVIPLFNIDAFFGSQSTNTIAAPGDKVAAIYKVPKTGSIDRVMFYVSAYDSTSGTPSVIVRVETITNATATVKHPIPSGTLQTTGASVTVSVSSTGWTTATLGTSASVTEGDIIAFVITGAKTSSTSRNVTIRRGMETHSAIYRGFPFPLNLDVVDIITE